MDTASTIDGLWIGLTDSSNNGTLGVIDDVAIYNKELSQEEVTRNYNAGKRSHK